MSGQKTAVAARDESQPNSPISDHQQDATVIANKDAKCTWNGQEFSDGDSICAEGEHYVCNYGGWMKMPGGC